MLLISQYFVPAIRNQNRNLEIHSVSCLGNAVNPWFYTGLRDLENISSYGYLKHPLKVAEACPLVMKGRLRVTLGSQTIIARYVP